MRKAFFFATFSLLSLLPMAHAQYGGDPTRSYIDQMVRDNMNQRRAAESRRSSSAGKGKRRSSPTRSPRSAALKNRRTIAKPLPMSGTMEVTQDLYSPFGNNDEREFTLEVRLTPVGKSGKPIMRWMRFTPSKGWGGTFINDVPVGRYVASARVIDANKNVTPTLLGTRAGEPSDPQGGDFAPRQFVQLAVGQDGYGNRAIIQKGSLWFRPQVSQ